MEILKHGCFVKEAECKNCGCKFTYNTFRDTKFLYKDDREHSLESEVVKCPECGVNITLRKCD